MSTFSALTEIMSDQFNSAVIVTLIVFIIVIVLQIRKQMRHLRKVESALTALRSTPTELSVRQTWTIDNFDLLCHDNGDLDHYPSIQSARFGPIGGDDRLKFVMQIYPRGEDKESCEFVSFYLNMVSSEEEDSVSVIYRVYIVDRDGVKQIMMGEKAETKITKFVFGESGWGGQLLTRKELLDPNSGYLLGNKLTLSCEVLVIPSVHQQEKMNQEKHAKRISAADLYGNDKWSDVVLLVGGTEYPAHKFVLAARSVVFADMFRLGLKETHQNRVTIDEVDPPLFLQMLKFIYTGKIDEVQPFAWELLPLADKFQIDPLKTLCEQCLASQICNENVIDYLNYAQLHGAMKLKSKAVSFIRRQTTDKIRNVKDHKLHVLIGAIPPVQ